MGTAGTVLPSHYFFMLAKVKMVIVPYKGAGPLMIDASGGHVPLAIGAVSSVQTAVRAGRVRMLGVTSHSDAFPDVPLISKDVPGYDADTWFALFAPGATPKETIARIRDDLVAVLQIPDVRQRLLDIGGSPSGEPTAEFAARVKNEIAKWLKVAKRGLDCSSSGASVPDERAMQRAVPPLQGEGWGHCGSMPIRFAISACRGMSFLRNAVNSSGELPTAKYRLPRGTCAPPALRAPSRSRRAGGARSPRTPAGSHMP